MKVGDEVVLFGKDWAVERIESEWCVDKIVLRRSIQDYEDSVVEVGEDE